ncbi:GSCOCG00006817001-RA-CDS [Cotesia congregata]|uniref:Peroxin-19 n=1 Tax=Cotesia congregata TaxID=51543 RepID=A0A8J2MXH9_COTCN|nr:GSCOCG00006817001-RA-CDS [Cotesia congregata]CAG5103499.1 Similar to Pex19: Peroxisomal biogenesis factor 19 (Mus musculus) [Cotesia congregata]
MSDKNKSNKQSADPELDDLLSNALGDFDRLSVTNEQKQDQTASSTSKEVTKDLEKSPEPLIDEMWSQEFINQTASQFQKNLQKIIQNGSDGDFNASLAKMAQTVAESMASTSGADGESAADIGDNLDFQAAIAQAFKDIPHPTEEMKASGSGFNETELLSMFGQPSDESGGDIFPFMQGMMQSLLSKEVLYPPLKDLVDKYPDWLDEKKSNLAAADFERYTRQFLLMQKVCKELETEKSDDADEVKKSRFDKVLDLMHEMQTCGQPPDDLIGEQTGLFQLDDMGNPVLPPGVDPSNCCIM